MRSTSGLNMCSKIAFLLLILLASDFTLGFANSATRSSSAPISGLFSSAAQTVPCTLALTDGLEDVAANATGTSASIPTTETVSTGSIDGMSGFFPSFIPPPSTPAFPVAEATSSLSILSDEKFLPYISSPSSTSNLSVNVATPGKIEAWITLAPTMGSSASNYTSVMTVPENEKISFVAPTPESWPSLGLNVSFMPVNESTSLNVTAAARTGNAIPLNSTAGLLNSTPGQAMYFRNVSHHDAWLYPLSKCRRTEECQCFDPASKCCTTGDTAVGPFCVPINGTCCADTYCMPGEQCCGDGCCPVGSDCQAFPSGCCKSNSTCNVPATCHSYTESRCANVSDNAALAMECCPSSLPFCAALPGSGAGCYAVPPTISVSSGKHGTTTVTVVSSVPTGVYIATETPATTWACTIYTTVQSSATSGSSSSGLCFDQILLSAVSCPQTTTHPITTVFSRPATTSGDFHAPGIVTLRMGKAPGRKTGGMFCVVAAVVGVVFGR